MTEQNALDAMEVKMDASNLYKEEVVSDRKVGTIRVLTPITTSGERDLNRQCIYLGETQIMLSVGPLPISFEIDAKDLAEAVEKYGESAKQGVRDTIEKIRKMREEAANQIVTPGMPGFQAPPTPGQGSGLVMP